MSTLVANPAPLAPDAAMARTLAEAFKRPGLKAEVRGGLVTVTIPLPGMTYRLRAPEKKQ